uniref:Uncharacterized protein n=1 Tax=viral metagenome TaxID=1070528 RepID=A0A2V0RCA0_9ZZZZ
MVGAKVQDGRHVMTNSSLDYCVGGSCSRGRSHHGLDLHNFDFWAMPGGRQISNYPWALVAPFDGYLTEIRASDSYGTLVEITSSKQLLLDGDRDSGHFGEKRYVMMRYAHLGVPAVRPVPKIGGRVNTDPSLWHGGKPGDLLSARTLLNKDSTVIYNVWNADCYYANGGRNLEGLELLQIDNGRYPTVMNSDDTFFPYKLELPESVPDDVATEIALAVGYTVVPVGALSAGRVAAKRFGFKLAQRALWTNPFTLAAAELLSPSMIATDPDQSYSAGLDAYTILGLNLNTYLKAGTPVGFAGLTGNTINSRHPKMVHSGIHLHYEMFISRNKRDWQRVSPHSISYEELL